MMARDSRLYPSHLAFTRTSELLSELLAEVHQFFRQLLPRHLPLTESLKLYRGARARNGTRLVQLKLRVDLRKRSDVPNGWSLSLHRSGFFLEFEGILPSRVHPTPTDFQISDLLQDSFLLEIKRRTVGKQWFGAEL